MRKDPEATQRWADANQAYLALENEVAAIFEAEAGEAEGTVATRWDHPMLTVKGDVNRVTRARMREGVDGVGR
ncbi:MAG: hypothetical protein IH977_13900 [Nitrospinae bacterium]|nr:hypothetical protein [Nitrospinota bacterium]